MLKKSVRLLLVLLLTAALLVPPPVSAAELYFTSVNDSLLPLADETMPAWISGTLYVPYTVFDSSVTGISLGLYCNYNRSEGTVMFISLSQILTFNLNAGTCIDEMTQNQLSGRAIMRYGRPFVPVGLICTFFGLASSYTPIAQGYLVRIRNSSANLTDAKFIDAAGNLINFRLREYTQSMEPETPGGPGSYVPGGTDPGTPPKGTEPEPEVPPVTVPTYLAFQPDTVQEAEAELAVLADSGFYGLFFLTPAQMAESPDLVRRIPGTGHFLGIAAEGAGTEDTTALLAQGSGVLSQTAYQRTSAALVPDAQRAAFAGSGWVCWNTTLDMIPDAGVSPDAYAVSMLRYLEGRTENTYLLLRGSGVSAVLPALLEQLAAENFIVSTPLEVCLP